MMNTDAVVTLPASTSPQRVEDRLAEMTDGTFEVVAFEVFDHPSASGEGDDRRGVWFLGRRAAVVELLQVGFEEYSEFTSRGVDDPMNAAIQTVELTVKLTVNVAAWQLAYGDQGGAAGLAEDVRSYVEGLIGDSSQAREGGEGGLADVEVDLSV